MVYPELPKLAQEEYDYSARRFLLCIHTQDYGTAEYSKTLDAYGKFHWDSTVIIDGK